MNKPTPALVPPSKIAEAAAFLRAQKALTEWKEKYEEALEELRTIESVYNATLTAADKAVRARGVSCGPFELQSFVTEYDAEALYAEVGRNRFPQCGGKLEPIEVKTVDKERFDALAAAGNIDPKLIAKVVSFSPRYKAVKRIALP